MVNPGKRVLLKQPNISIKEGRHEKDWFVCIRGGVDTEIHIGQWGPQTGPAAPWGAVARGTDAYFKMINAEGGINGRKLVHHYFDDAYNPAKTLAGVKQLQEDVGIFAWVSGVGSLTDTGIPVVSSNPPASSPVGLLAV